MAQQTPAEEWARQNGLSYDPASGQWLSQAVPDDAFNPTAWVNAHKVDLNSAYNTARLSNAPATGQQTAMGYTQQAMQATDPANAAATQALAGTQGRAAPGQDPYSQRLQEMMLGQFAPDDPSYQWRLEQGTENLARKSASMGGFGSGAMAAELQQYGQQSAAQEYAAQFNRLLAASGNATGQYTAAYNTLGNMLSARSNNQQVAQGWDRQAQGWGQVATGQQGAATQAGQLGVQQGGLMLQQKQFNANEDFRANQDLGAAAALNSGIYHPTQQQTQLPAAPSGYSYNTPTVMQSAGQGVTNNTASNLPQGSGYITSSSGNTSTFGGYTGATPFGGL